MNRTVHHRGSLPMRLLLLALGCCVALAQPAWAHSPEAAYAAYADEDDVTARRWLGQWLDSARADAAGLAQAAQLARELKDADLLRTVRALGEEWERDGARVDLALGWAYLGLAEVRIEEGTAGSSVSLLMADVQTRAERHPELEAAVVLLAEKRTSEGDPAGAIETLTAWRERHSAGPQASLLEGRLRYLRAAAQPTDADGRLGAAAAAELQLAIELIAVALDDLAQGPIGRMRRDGHLYRAWAAHRLGQVEDATTDYLEAYAPGTRAGRLSLRGLASLHARSPGTLVRLCLELQRGGPTDPDLLEALARAHAFADDPQAAMAVARARVAGNEGEAPAWLFLGLIARSVGDRAAATAAYVRALGVDPGSAQATQALEQLAQELLADDPHAAVKAYEDLLALRPGDAFVRNNFGFILRDLVTPHTDLLDEERQALKADAPAFAHAWLRRSVAVYLEAVALIPEADDGRREVLEDWNLAGIVNDAGLMLHYFVDVADPLRAEALYLRALRMTEFSFKDTYVPNLRRLYGHVLEDREWTWMAIARKAKDAILVEATDPDGAPTLAPDEAKRALAAADELALRERIVERLRREAEADGRPWPAPVTPAPAPRSPPR